MMIRSNIKKPSNLGELTKKFLIKSKSNETGVTRSGKLGTTLKSRLHQNLLSHEVVTRSRMKTENLPFLESVARQFSSLPIFVDCNKVRKLRWLVCKMSKNLRHQFVWYVGFMDCHTICSFVPSLAVALDFTRKLLLQNFKQKRSLKSLIKSKLVDLCFRPNRLKTGSKCIPQPQSWNYF